MAYGIIQDIARCRELLKKGEVVAVPTETVYGLAANAFDENAVRKIFELKGRPLYNPLIVHIHQLEQLQELTSQVPEAAYKLAKTFWPGPLTLILPKNAKVTDLITAGKPTVGIRMPRHGLTIRLLGGLDFPLVAPSANPFTRISPTTAKHVDAYFGDKIGAVLDGGPCQVGLESTIVGFEEGIPIIYRKGGIAVAQIEAVVGKVKLLTKEEKTPVAPGMLAKHYAPQTQLILTDDVAGELERHSNKKVGILSFSDDSYRAVEKLIMLSERKDLQEAAQKLFNALHEMDSLGLDIIIAERMPDEGLGMSINDRLQRAQYR